MKTVHKNCFANVINSAAEHSFLSRQVVGIDGLKVSKNVHQSDEQCEGHCSQQRQKRHLTMDSLLVISTTRKTTKNNGSDNKGSSNNNSGAGTTVNTQLTTKRQPQPNIRPRDLTLHLSDRNYGVGNANNGLYDGASQALAQSLHETRHAALLSSARGSLEDPRNPRGDPFGDIFAPLVSNRHSSGRGKRGQGVAPLRATSASSLRVSRECRHSRSTSSCSLGGIGREQSKRTRFNVYCLRQRGNLICWPTASVIPLRTGHRRDFCGRA